MIFCCFLCTVGVLNFFAKHTSLFYGSVYFVELKKNQVPYPADPPMYPSGFAYIRYSCHLLRKTWAHFSKLQKLGVNLKKKFLRYFTNTRKIHLLMDFRKMFILESTNQHCNPKPSSCLQYDSLNSACYMWHFIVDFHQIQSVFHKFLRTKSRHVDCFWNSNIILTTFSTLLSEWQHTCRPSYGLRTSNSLHQHSLCSQTSI